MSCLNSGRRRSASSGVSPVGWKFQNSPWWTSTSCAPSSTARSLQLAPRGDARDHARDLARARDLQAVGPEVVELAG